MSKNVIFIVGLIVGLLVGLGLGKYMAPSNTNSPNNSITNNTNTNNTTKTTQSTSQSIPDYATQTLAYINEHNDAPDGYVGGRKFTNREKVLPQTTEGGDKINYQEWDVHPKIQGQNRGAERLCTGSDGRAWFTQDHYKTFTQIK